MRVVLGTQALVQHYLNQQIAEARSFRATIVEGNPKESQKQRKLANESEALVENVKVILSDQLRGLKGNYPEIFEQIDISEANLHSLGAVDLLPEDSTLRDV